MPKFDYVALDARGQESRGTMDAASQNDVVLQLRQAGLFPTSVAEAKAGAKPAKAGGSKKKAGGGGGMFQRKTVSSKVLMIFTRQLATLIDAGLPLLRGLDVLGKQEKDPVLKKIIMGIAEAVQGGSTFSESMSQYPKVFSRLYVNMVKAGELGGVLEIVLNRLAEFQEKAEKLRNKVKSAMTYPVVVLSIAVLIMVFLLTFIVPRFQTVFNDMLNGKPLPALTLFVMNLSKNAQEYWYLLGGGIFGTFLLAKTFMASTKGRAAFDKVALRSPIFGDILRKSSISRFTRTLGTLVTSGVPILQALMITRETAGNSVVADAVMKVHDAVKEGESVVTPLESCGVFPPMVISMVDVGEETGQLPDMLMKIAEVYDDEGDNSVEGLTSLLEPLMIVFLAVIVGTIVIALFLPMIDLIKGMSDVKT
jgi:type IV pilus assembly protein PilC